MFFFLNLLKELEFDISKNSIDLSSCSSPYFKILMGEYVIKHKKGISEVFKNILSICGGKNTLLFQYKSNYIVIVNI